MKLSTKYLINIVASILFFPIAFLGVNFLYYVTLTYLIDHQGQVHYEPNKLESDWKSDVEGFSGKSNREITSAFPHMKQYKHSDIVWINDKGKVMFSNSERLAKKGEVIHVSELIKLMEQNQKKYLLLSAYVNGSEDSGYAFLETPRSIIGSQWEVMRAKYSYIWFIALIFVCSLFVINSWMFFAKIQKRLISLGNHMKKQDNDGIPEFVTVKQKDELGQVEYSFNQMVEELRNSRQKEREEGEIRKNLIADLSHDLRTPLTVIRGHTFTLKNEISSENGKHSLGIINDKITFMGELIDNLSSFSLLAAGKLPLHKKSCDILKIIRSSLTAWYPIFEKEHFTIDIDLQENIEWEIDETWLKRILDNIFQNVLRHAHSGKYVSVQTKLIENKPVIIIEDRGPGMNNKSERKGAGIGLSIINMMLKQMGLEHKIKSNQNGTVFIIYPNSNEYVKP